MSETAYIDIVFDGPPGPESGRFVEVEDAAGKSITCGTWILRADGLWALRITGAELSTPAKDAILQSSDNEVKRIIAEKFPEQR
jgi:hypothetical protein